MGAAARWLPCWVGTEQLPVCSLLVSVVGHRVSQVAGCPSPPGGDRGVAEDPQRDPPKASPSAYLNNDSNGVLQVVGCYGDGKGNNLGVKGRT